MPGIHVGTRIRNRIPHGPDREAALDQLERFLIKANEIISWYQIQNEPFGGPGMYTAEEFDSGAAFEWMEAAGKMCVGRLFIGLSIPRQKAGLINTVRRSRAG